MRPDRFFAWLAFATVSFVWGTTYLAIAVAIETLPTFLFPAIRFVIGGAILLAIRLALGKKLPASRSDWLNLGLIGFLLVAVGNVAVVFAEHHMTSGFAALLIATAPFWMAILELLRTHGERVTPRRLVGMLIGFSGVVVLVAPELHADFDIRFLLSALIVQASALAWNYGSIRSKYELSRDLDPLVAASIQMILGGLAAGLIGLAVGESPVLHFTWRSFAAFSYLVVFGSVIGYGSYVYALAKLPTSTVTLHTYINPAVAVFLGWLVLSEPLGWNAIAAMIVILSGVAVVQRAKPVLAAGEATAVVKEVAHGDEARPGDEIDGCEPEGAAGGR